MVRREEVSFKPETMVSFSYFQYKSKEKIQQERGASPLQLAHETASL